MTASAALPAEVDLFVIGAGSGGVRAARIAAGYGARVAIAEEYRVGGTCVIRGCVPKKLLVYASRFAHEFEDAAGFGWTVPAPSFDWPTLIANKDREIDRLERAYVANLQKPGVVIVRSRAVIADRAHGPAGERRDHAAPSTSWSRPAVRRAWASRSPGSSMSSRPTRRFICRRCRRACWSRAAAISRSNSPRSSPASAPR